MVYILWPKALEEAEALIPATCSAGRTACFPGGG